MSFAGLVTPFFASFFGWYFLGETISWHYFASIIVFSIGLTIFYLEELKRDKVFLKAENVSELKTNEI
jgi:drug/metabolite transporter (DMT)-like permease